MTDSCVVVPALDPPPELIDFVRALINAGFGCVLVIDDGSEKRFSSTFSGMESLGAVVLRHSENRGKGAALKTGFSYARTLGATVVVTADADGQHAPADVVRVAEAVLDEEGTCCVLGVRSFAGEVPLRSRFGNRLTQHIFAARSKLSVADTQTGLRGFSGSMLPMLLDIPGERYEFEMEMLVQLVGKEIPIIQIPIQTIYRDNNQHSHFRPIIDSFRIYWVLFRDMLVATSSFGVDITLFSAGFALSGDVLASTYLARVVSATYNFLLNRQFVFKTGNNKKLLYEAGQYTLLAIALATVSGTLVGYCYDLTKINVTVCKVIVDTTIYGLSFMIRRYVIFRHRSVVSQR